MSSFNRPTGSSVLGNTSCPEVFKNTHGTAVKLTASDYRQWANDITILLLADRALDIVEGREDPPVAPPPPGLPAPGSSSAGIAEQATHGQQPMTRLAASTTSPGDTINVTPQGTPQPSGLSNDSDVHKLFTKLRKDYDKRKYRAVATIHGSISMGMQAYVAHLRDPKVM